MPDAINLRDRSAVLRRSAGEVAPGIALSQVCAGDAGVLAPDPQLAAVARVRLDLDGDADVGAGGLAGRDVDAHGAPARVRDLVIEARGAHKRPALCTLLKARVRHKVVGLRLVGVVAERELPIAQRQRLGHGGGA